MRAGYRKFFMFAQVATLIGIGYLMTRFWEDAKNNVNYIICLKSFG